MIISKSKIIALAISVLYVVILSTASFKRIPLEYSDGSAIDPSVFIVVGLLLILISPKTHINVSESFWDKELFWITLKLFGWMCLLLFVPFMMIFLYKG